MTSPHAPVAVWQAVLAAVLAALVAGLSTAIALSSRAATRQDVIELRTELAISSRVQTARINMLSDRVIRLEQKFTDLLVLLRSDGGHHLPR
jgi:hypothetical protein